jgi:hypothetical protein
MASTVDNRTATAESGRQVGAVLDRWIAVAGFLYVAAWLAGLIIGFATSGPAPTDSVQKIETFFRTHREIAMIQAYLLDGIAGIALIGFAAALRAQFRRGEGENGVASTVLLGAGIAAGTVSLIQGLFTQVLADRVATMGNGATVRALYDLNTEGDTYKLLAVGAFLGAVALLTFRTGLFPRWTGWVAAILGPLLAIAGWNFVLSASAQYAAYAVLLLALLAWVLVVSIISFRRNT